MKLIIFLLLSFLAQAVELQKAKIYSDDKNITNWYMSEKLDGIRGFWDGKTLQTRASKELFAPKDFTHNFPPFELDGELWTKRGDFENIQNIVMDKNPTNWDKITYNIFEAPSNAGNFDTRLQKAKDWFTLHPNKYVRFIEQTKCSSTKDLHNFLDKILKLGGEGLMLKNPDALYKNGKSDDILKFKKYNDDEGEVVKINISKKTGKIGSLTLKLSNGVVFNLGSGFDSKFHQNPPKIKDMVTFKFFGFTKNGKPKFASFIHIRRD